MNINKRLESSRDRDEQHTRAGSDIEESQTIKRGESGRAARGFFTSGLLRQQLAFSHTARTVARLLELTGGLLKQQRAFGNTGIGMAKLLGLFHRCIAQTVTCIQSHRDECIKPARASSQVGRSTGSKASMRCNRRRAPLSALTKYFSKFTRGFLRMFIKKRRAFSLRTCATARCGKTM